MKQEIKIKIAKFSNGRIIIMGDNYQSEEENMNEIKEISENICINEGSSLQSIEFQKIKV